MTRVAVVGGGITGLAAAWELLRSGAAVTVLEAGRRLGGKILTGEVAGRAVDLGADAVLARVPEGLALCQELGLADEVVHPAVEGAAVWVGGRLRPLPSDVVLGVPTRLSSLARSGLLSPTGLARAALDRVVPARGREGDRSVGEVVRARFGREVHERLVDPLLGGIHAGDSDQLSLEAVAPQLAAVAAGGGSLMVGLRPRGQAARSGGPVFWSLRGGLGRLVQRLEEQLRAGGASLSAGTAVRSLGGLDADAVVVCTPAPAAAELVAEAEEAAAELRAIDHASVVVTVLVYPAHAVAVPLPGTGFVVPRSEGRLLTACSFASSKWPHWAPPGKVVLRASAGRLGDERAMGLDDDSLVGGLHAELTQVLRLTALPEEARVVRWPGAFPQYRVGHLERVARIDDGLARHLPGVVVAGAAHRGIGVAACISQGRRAARRVLRLYA